MSDNLYRPQQTVTDDEIDLRELFAVIWRGKWIIIAVTAVFAVASVFYALSLPNIYKSEALLAPAAEQKSAGLSGQLGGLAALAGVSLGSGAGVDKVILAMEVIKSREFTKEFIEKHQLAVPLIAIERWEQTTGEIVIDPNIYDTVAKKWVRNVVFPQKSEPSDQELHEAFTELIDIKRNDATGMVVLSVYNQSPILAQYINLNLVKDVNEKMRENELAEFARSIAYLQNEIETTSLSGIRAVLFNLIEEQNKNLMLANVREEYIFKTVDRAVVPEKKAKPSRALICVVITFIGVMFSVLLVLIRQNFRESH